MASSFTQSMRSALRLVDRGSLIFIMSRLLAIAGLEVGMILATWLLFKMLLGNRASSEFIADPQRLAMTLSAILCFMLLRTLGTIALWSSLIRQLCNEQSKLGGRLFEAYVKLPYVQLITTDRSRMLEKLRIASRTLHQDMLMPVLLFVSNVLVAVAILAALFILAPGPTILILSWLLFIFGVIFRLITKMSRRLAIQKRTAFQGLRELDEWTFRQARVVRLMASEDVITSRQKQLCQETADTIARLSVAAVFPRYVSELALLTSTILLFLWFTYVGETSATVLRELSIFTIAGMRLLPAGQQAITMVNQLQHGLPDTSEILEDLRAPQMALPPANDGSERYCLFEEDITLDNISFGYAGTLLTIPEGTSLSLHKGEWLHVRGPSGAGKTTLIALMLGLLEPRAGRVTIDGVPGIAHSRFRGGAVALVAPDSGLLPGTIADNLAFPNPPSGLDVEAATRLMAALGLEFDLEMAVGEDGARLSGGQRQRITVLKALLTAPELLVLDEATSQLDTATEAAVFDLVRTHLPTTTVIVVAHKLESDLPFDRLWEWCDGKWHETRCAS